jgi:hypothetical protein
LPDDAVVREVVRIEVLYLTKCFGEHAPIEAEVGAFGEVQQSLSVVPSGLDGRVDVDEVAGECPRVEGSHLVGDGVIGVQDRPDRHVDRFVGA